ncbi:ArsR family transcriptional regulator [Radiobacillus kanasensis]|uniref:ArsR/SmtB family transcription factor n=1 Tax=Radiobacillus kanasensis TaxID=2844358 RepID=UPI001E5ADE5A|nr:metalloregulator ArsR/SmtB family transcription factor [Radiobacillus kanasensis]UFU00101.1 ArsR family transcriptional regulator [Radiobacillus kanasensis]
MEVLNLASKKRETYSVQIKHSVLWECALGIAAVTNKRLIKTLEKQMDYWEELRKNLSEELSTDLKFVEKNNTWKTLLQLLHAKDFDTLDEFANYIENLTVTELKFISLPFVGFQYQETRQEAAEGNKIARGTLKKLTCDNPFFPSYIDFIGKEDGQLLKEHLIRVMTRWYQEVVESELKKVSEILEVDSNSKKHMAEKMCSEEFVEWATGGITYLPEPSVNEVLLIPQFVYRPWNIEADLEGTKVFYYPVANESITPDDRYTPNHNLVLKYKALGDEARMRLVKLLYEADRSLQDITEQLDIGKSTIHHHLKILRSAKLVGMNGSKYSLKKRSIELLSKEIYMYLDNGKSK